jgi:hypothetical protein
VCVFFTPKSSEGPKSASQPPLARTPRAPSTRPLGPITALNLLGARGWRSGERLGGDAETPGGGVVRGPPLGQHSTMSQRATQLVSTALLVLITGCGTDQDRTGTLSSGETGGGTTSTTQGTSTDGTSTTINSGTTGHSTQTSDATSMGTSRGESTTTTGSTSSAPDSDGTSTGGESTGVNYCECVTSQPIPKSCHFFQQCQSDLDCCPDSLPPGYTCNDWPYLYRCKDSQCAMVQCMADSQCAKQFQATLMSYPNATNKGCAAVKVPCYDTAHVCQIDIGDLNACASDADCCQNIPAPFTCDDYPFRRRCENGSCTSEPCTNDSQCDKYFEQSLMGLGYTNLGCEDIETPCDGPFTTCNYTQICQTDADCCNPPPPEGYTCNDWPYRKACKAGRCATDGCTADSQCTNFYKKVYEAAGLINDGCY